MLRLTERPEENAKRACPDRIVDVPLHAGECRKGIRDLPMIIVNHAKISPADSVAVPKDAGRPVPSAATAYPGMPRTGLRNRAVAKEDCIS